MQYKMKIECIFDIAHKNAELMIKVQADKDFLADQRGDRKMSLAGIDKKLSAQEQHAEERKQT